MEIYKILAIINVILIAISYITGRFIKNDLSAWLGVTGTINGITNLLLWILIPTNIILFILKF